VPHLSPVEQAADAPALRIRNLSKTFHVARVLKDVDITIRPGEIRALVGANGSGKSTLVKILARIHEPDDGAAIEVDGQNPLLGHGAAADALRFVHQDLGLVPSLSVIDNTALGDGYRSLRHGRLHLREEARQVRSALAELGYDIEVQRPLGELTACEQTTVAIARALRPRSVKAKLLVLDEPTANLPAADVNRLIGLIRQVRSTGVAVLFISHHLDEVFALADSVTVLRDGRVIGTRPVDGLTEPQLVEMMLGRAVVRLEQPPHTVVTSTPSVLCAEGVSGSVIRDFDLTLHEGEIVGIAGISGSGRDEIAGLLFGTSERVGRVSVAGKTIPPGRPDMSMSAGIGLVPADRRTNAAFMEATLRENICTALHRPHISKGLLRIRRERSTATSWLERLGVVPQNAEAKMLELSGGNQQRTILARWLRINPKVLILDEPTQGVDVGAKAEIHGFLRDAAANGAGVVVVSTDDEELVRLCQRVLILRSGRVIDEMRAPNIDVDRLVVGVVGSHLVDHERLHQL